MHYMPFSPPDLIPTFLVFCCALFCPTHLPLPAFLPLYLLPAIGIFLWHCVTTTCYRFCTLPACLLHSCFWFLPRFLPQHLHSALPWTLALVLFTAACTCLPPAIYCHALVPVACTPFSPSSGLFVYSVRMNNHYYVLPHSPTAFCRFSFTDACRFLHRRSISPYRIPFPVIHLVIIIIPVCCNTNCLYSFIPYTCNSSLGLGILCHHSVITCCSSM